MPLYHIVIGRLAKVARMGISTMHHENSRADFVDVVKETTVGVGLRTDDAPAVVRVA